MSIITSNAVITAIGIPPDASRNSSTASLVIDHVSTLPPTSILTCAVVVPSVTNTIYLFRKSRTLNCRTSFLRFCRKQPDLASSGSIAQADENERPPRDCDRPTYYVNHGEHAALRIGRALGRRS